MLKWKRDYHLLQVQKPKHKVPLRMIWKKDDGITLVELLASLAILSVVILLVGSVHIFGQRQFVNQTESASQANDLTYALSVMSRDLRKQEAATVSLNETSNQILINDAALFTHVGTDLKKGSEVLSSRVSNAEFVINMKDAEKESLTIILSSTGNQQNQSNKYQTTIYFRR
ncbi:PilW family protein [Alkalibacterium putridalgicola]|uniref:PilW family protein n=1 Tax=Alkalibacterium putridalgicola TaxID=426703 RepID=UPI0034D00DA4